MLLSVSANLKHAAMLKRLGYDALDVDLCNVIYSGGLHDILKADGYDVCYCLDVGHAHLNRKYDNDIPSVVRRLGSRLQMLHLHDNCRNRDLHAVPFAGTIPWEETMVALKEIGYPGDFNLEIDFARVPPALLEDHLRYSARVARYLMSVFENA